MIETKTRYPGARIIQHEDETPEYENKRHPVERDPVAVR